MKVVSFTSCGNDSVALLQYLFEDKNVQQVTAVYSNTGWAHKDWPSRVEEVKKYVEYNGGVFVEIGSKGFEDLCWAKRGFPSPVMKFCSYELKIKPAKLWLKTFDPNKDFVCAVGIRREESPRRSQWPEWVEESYNHGGRPLWAPLVRYDTVARDELIIKAGFDVLQHRSYECYPCIHATKKELAVLEPWALERVKALESRLGDTHGGMPRVMYRPTLKRGASGIEEIVRWANTSAREPFVPAGSCESGFCE